MAEGGGRRGVGHFSLRVNSPADWALTSLKGWLSTMRAYMSIIGGSQSTEEEEEEEEEGPLVDSERG